jgi:hypothetical protein
MKMFTTNKSGVNGISDHLGVNRLLFQWHVNGVRYTKAILYNATTKRGHKRTRDEAWKELTEFRDGVMERTGSNNGKRSKLVDYDRFRLTQDEIEIITKQQRVKGVRDDPTQHRIRASFMNKGVTTMKNFSYTASSGVSKDEAYQKACEWRRKIETSQVESNTV